MQDPAAPRDTEPTPPAARPTQSPTGPTTPGTSCIASPRPTSRGEHYARQVIAGDVRMARA